MTMTQDEILDLRQVKNARAIRVAVYDVAILIGGILLLDKLIGTDAWVANSAFKGILIGCLGGLWLACIVQRYRDWRSITRIEEKLIEERLSHII